MNKQMIAQAIRNALSRTTYPKHKPKYNRAVAHINYIYRHRHTAHANHATAYARIAHIAVHNWDNAPANAVAQNAICIMIREAARN